MYYIIAINSEVAFSLCCVWCQVVECTPRWKVVVEANFRNTTFWQQSL